MTAQTDPYVRVYYRVLADDKFRSLSSAAWGHWVRLLVIADSMHPSSAPLPRWVERKPLQELVAARIVDLEGGDYFRIHGMTTERAQRTEAATFAAEVKHHGLAEATRRQAERAGSSGRMQPDAGAARGAAAQPLGRAEPASPLLSAPLLSEPLHSGRTTVLKDMSKKKPDDEELMDTRLQAWADPTTSPAIRETLAAWLSQQGVRDPAAELARRRAA
jgi:hypothetical protein